MSKLILYPSDISQWHALVNEAQLSTQMQLNQETESYLVFLLMRSSQSTGWIDSVVALDALEARHSLPKHKIEILCEVGDKSLLFSGLFPGIAERRHVSLQYYTEMGRAAYLTVSELQPPQSALLYKQLGKQFKALQTVLQSMRSDYYQSLCTNHSKCVWLKNNSLQ